MLVLNSPPHKRKQEGEVAWMILQDMKPRLTQGRQDLQFVLVVEGGGGAEDVVVPGAEGAFELGEEEQVRLVRRHVRVAHHRVPEVADVVRVPKCRVVRSCSRVRKQVSGRCRQHIRTHKQILALTGTFLGAKHVCMLRAIK